MEALHFVDFEPLDKLYIMAAPTYDNHSEWVKIGVSKNPWKRLKACRAQYDHLLKVVVVYEVDNARKIEALVKKKFKDRRVKNIYTEFFDMDAGHGEITAFIENECGVVVP